MLNHRRLRQFWLNLHLYIALSVGFLFALLGVTGSFNVFHWELEELSLPTVKHEHDAKPLGLNVLMQNIRDRHPLKTGRWLLFMPGYERDYVWAVFPKPEETRDEFFAPLRIQLNPYDGRVAGEHFWGKTLGTLVYSLHASLLTGKFWGPKVGKIGFKIIAFLGLFLLVSVATGIYLWWPRTGKFVKALTLKRSASATRFHFDLHRVTGFYGSAILAIIAFTGFSFGYLDYLKPVVNLFSPVHTLHFRDPEGLKSKLRDEAEPISVEAAVDIADQIFPGAELRWLATPDGPEGIYAVEKRQPGEANRRRPRSKVWIDQYSGEVLAQENPNTFTAGETFLNLMWPLHNGEFLGLFSRIIWCLTGLVPLILYVTGLKIWLKKTKAKRRNEALTRSGQS